MSLNDSLKGYIAGIIDGEGCITINISRRKNGRRNYTTALYVCMTDRQIPELLHKLFGGALNLRKTRNLKHKSVYCWRLHGNKAKKALQDISSLLILKKPQAELLIKMQKLLASPNINSLRKGLTPEEQIKRDVLYNQMRILNKKGI